jgi:hypothetical protein
MAHAVTPHTMELPALGPQQQDHHHQQQQQHHHHHHHQRPSPPAAAAAASSGPSSPPRGATASAGRAKRSLKQKLHTAIQQADGAEQAGQQEQQAAQRVDAKSLCLQLLAEGRPAAFVDFFQLTHPAPAPAAAPAAQAAAGQARAADAAEAGELPEGVLLYVKQQLAAAEEASRAGDPGTAHEAYMSLAKVFEDLQASARARWVAGGAWLAGLQLALWGSRRCVHLVPPGALPGGVPSGERRRHCWPPSERQRAKQGALRLAGSCVRPCSPPARRARRHSQ